MGARSGAKLSQLGHRFAPKKCLARAGNQALNERINPLAETTFDTVFLLQIIIFLGGATVLALLIAWPFMIIGRLRFSHRKGWLSLQTVRFRAGTETKCFCT
jgi:hypothetical protein